MQVKKEQDILRYKVRRIGGETSTWGKWYSSITGSISHSINWLFSSQVTTRLENPTYIKKSDEQDDVVIYCTHGTGDQPGAFNQLLNYLITERKLPHNVHSVHLMAFKGRYQGKGIEWFAEQLAKDIVTNNHRRVVLFGHSRGGIVNAYMAEILARQHGITVEGLFHFGAPFGSSYLAKWPLTLVSTSVEQMAPESPFLKDLNKAMTKSSLKHYFYVAGQDSIVWENAAIAEEYVINQERATPSLDESEQPQEEITRLEDDSKSPSECLVIIMEKHNHISMLTSHEIVGDIEKNMKATLTTSEKNNEDVSITLHHKPVIYEDYSGSSNSP